MVGDGGPTARRGGVLRPWARPAPRSILGPGRPTASDHSKGGDRCLPAHAAATTPSTSATRSSPWSAASSAARTSTPPIWCCRPRPTLHHHVAPVSEPGHLGKQEVLEASCVRSAQVVAPVLGALGDLPVEEGRALPNGPSGPCRRRSSSAPPPRTARRGSRRWHG